MEACLHHTIHYVTGNCHNICAGRRPMNASQPCMTCSCSRITTTRPASACKGFRPRALWKHFLALAASALKSAYHSPSLAKAPGWCEPATPAAASQWVYACPLTSCTKRNTRSCHCLSPMPARREEEKNCTIQHSQRQPLDLKAKPEDPCQPSE